MHHFLAQNVYLDPCKNNFLTPENSVEKDEKPIPKWADFEKVKKVDLFKKPFQGPKALKYQPILMFYASFFSSECLFGSL